MCYSKPGVPSLLVVDAVIPEGNIPHPGKLMDITMLAVTGGRERTVREFGSCLNRRGCGLTV